VILLAPLVFIFIVLPIAAVFLRAAISLSNRILGASSVSGVRSVVEVPHSAGQPDDGSNPYATPGTVTIEGDLSGGVDPIPEPTFGSACGIVLATGILTFVVAFVVNFLGSAGMVDPLLLQAISQVIGFGIAIIVNKSMLPTSLGRAALVYLMQIVLAIVVAGVLAVVAVATWKATSQ
jgi:hypothetical protein